MSGMAIGFFWEGPFLALLFWRTGKILSVSASVLLTVELSSP